MDISEIQNIKIKGDKLQALFDAQIEVEKLFGEIEGFKRELIFGQLTDLHVPETCRHITDNILWRMTQEIHEAVIALRNAKTWRRAKYFTDVNEYLDEVADIFIYFINLCLASGIDTDLLAQSVLKKIKINKERISSKY